MIEENEIIPLVRINGRTTIYGKSPLRFFKDRIEELQKSRITKKVHLKVINKTIETNRAIIIGGLSEYTKVVILQKWLDDKGPSDYISGELALSISNRVRAGRPLEDDAHLLDDILLRRLRKIEEYV